MSKLSCGCTPDASGYGYCPECRRKLREKIWKNMSEKDRNYDRHFAPEKSKKLDKSIENREYNTGCSCHINPPCSYCVDDNRGENSSEN